jgi:hypothetical protein
VAVGSVLWSVHGQLNATVIVKACFALSPDAPMAVVAPEPIALSDRHELDLPTRGLCGVRETVPQLRQVDVLVYGYAYAPQKATGGGKATESMVRLTVERDDDKLIDKRLLVRGDRKGEEEPVPFDRLRVGWERALGGIGVVDNPLGTGAGGSMEKQPNFLDPDDPTAKAASLGPLPPAFPARTKLRGSATLKELEALAAAIPPDLDWAFFQAAPEDQRLDRLRGDEWFTLEGMTNKPAALRTQLPGARAVARVFRTDQATVPDSVPLSADLIQIDMERKRCSIVWRGSFPIESEASAKGLMVAGGLELPDEAVQFPVEAAEYPASVFQRPSLGTMGSDLIDDAAETAVYEPGPSTPGLSSSDTVALATDAADDED